MHEKLAPMDEHIHRRDVWGDDPEEVDASETVAELRVINVRKNTAMAIVTSSRVEIEAGDKAYARKGY